MTAVNADLEIARQKQQLRKMIKHLRKQQTEAEIKEAGAKLADRIETIEKYQSASWLFCYLSCRGEADTSVLISRALKEGKRLAVPKVIGPGRMIFCEIHSVKNDTKPGAMGILEPFGDTLTVPGKDAVKKDILMVIPGLAFDKKKYRLGYGGGFYDAYMEKYPGIFSAAVCRAFQLVPKVPVCGHDRCPSVVVTENEIID